MPLTMSCGFSCLHGNVSITLPCFVFNPGCFSITVYHIFYLMYMPPYFLCIPTEVDKHQ